MKTTLTPKARASIPALLAVTSVSVQWTGADQRKALRQGWGLFEDDVNGLQVQRFDVADRFESDDAARTYVARFWRSGVAMANRNPTAFKAMELLAERKARGEDSDPLVTIHDPRFAPMPHLAHLP